MHTPNTQTTVSKRACALAAVAIFACLILCLTLTSRIAWTDESETSDANTGDAASEETKTISTSLSGSGTESDPYKIASEDDLHELITLINTKDSNAQYATSCYELTADLGSAESPIVLDECIGVCGNNYSYALTENVKYTDTYPFSGQFDGNGHTVYLNLSAGRSYVGLFGYIKGTEDDRPSVSNLVIEGSVANVATLEGAGSIAGYAQHADFANIVNHATVYGQGGKVGGIVGYGDDVTITRCSNSGTVTGDKWEVGGIIGSAYNSHNIIECANTADIGGTFGTGGIVGYSFAARATNTALIKDCYNTGNVNGDVSGRDTDLFRGVGGICGGAYNHIISYDGSDHGNADPKTYEPVTTIENCFNAGTVVDASDTNDDVSTLAGRRTTTGFNGSLVGKLYDTGGNATASVVIANVYYLEGTNEQAFGSTDKEALYTISDSSGAETTSDTLALSEDTMKSPEFAAQLGEAFVAVEGNYPALAWQQK